LVAGWTAALAGSAEEDWQAIVALDAGPQTQFRSAAEAKVALIAHLGAQEKALRAFSAAYPEDGHVFEARVRLSHLLTLRGEMMGDDKARVEAARLLDELEKSASPEQRAQIDFARLSQAMRRMGKPTPAEREALLGRVQAFQSAHPTDRRVAALLAEVATLFDLQPKTKRKLLLDAQTLAKDDDLKARVADDLHRVELLGQPIALASTTLDGKAVNVADYRGRLVVVCFFALWSEPATQALETVRRAVAEFPKERVQLLGVSLDGKPDVLAAFIKEKGIAAPIACDGKGWESPLVRAFGINALPTVWLLDRSGKLRSLNALENSVGQIRQLLAEK
jgi:peroxiredoxin